MTCRLLLLLTLLTASPVAARDLVPKVDKHVLDNGLRVFLLPDRSAPIVTFQMWVEVGSADEREGDPGITGLSHFFEHMMFKGTPKVPDYFRAMSERGAVLNAFTWIDETVYWEKVGSEHLEFVFEAEGDRFKNMKVDFLNLEPEREVVKSERLLRTENSPSGSLSEAVGASLYQKHSYHWPTVGWMRDLDAISIDEARAYHSRFYSAANTYLVIVGDFEPKQALALAKKHFGALEAKPVTRDGRTAEPKQTRERRTYVEKPVGTGLLQVAYRCPPGRDWQEFAVLEVIDSILTGGKSSRLQQAMVFGDDPIATSVSAFAFPFTDEGTYTFETELLPEKPNRMAEARLLREIDRLRTEPVTQEELQRAVAQLRAELVKGMATTQNRAQLIGFSIRASGDPTLPWKRLAHYGKVTADDVLRVAKRWLDPNVRVVGHAVDVRNVGALAETVVRGSPSSSKEADEATLGAVSLSLTEERARADAAAVSQEERAIGLLEKRAQEERNKLGQDAEGKAIAEKLEAYLTTGEKGTTKRRQKLAARKDALSKSEAKHAEAKAALVGQLEGLLKSEALVGNAPARARLTWALQLLGRGEKLPSLGDPPRELKPLAEWAVRALTFRRVLGDDVMGAVLKVVALRSSEDASLAAVHDFLHMIQKIDAGRM